MNEFDPTRYLIGLAGDRGNTQTRLAGAYAAALSDIEEVDWGAVNRAIIERWSLAGLSRVKRMAWDTAYRRSAPSSKQVAQPGGDE